MKEKIIALYIRLSVEDRDLDELKTASVSIQNQKVHLRNFLMCHPETASGEIREFIDDGYTGTNMDRPAFQEMMKLAREEQISCIVVKDFSRFGRNYLEVGNYLEQIFPLLGIRFISVDDGYDSKQNQGDVPGLDVVFKNIIHDYYSKELSVKEAKIYRSKEVLSERFCELLPFALKINKQDISGFYFILDYTIKEKFKNIKYCI